MPDQFFIFGAVYAFVIPIVAVLWVFFRLGSFDRKRMVGFAVFSLPITYLVDYFAGKLYYNPRPFVSDGVMPLIKHNAVNGFPSDHTILCGALAALIGPFYPRLSLWMWVVTIFVGLSRVYVGVHHIVDIIASVAITAVVGWLVWKSGLVNKIAKKEGQS